MERWTVRIVMSVKLYPQSDSTKCPCLMITNKFYKKGIKIESVSFGD